MEKVWQAYGDREHLLNFANQGQFIGTISSQSDNWQKRIYKYTRKPSAWRKDIVSSNGKGGDQIVTGHSRR